MIYAMKELPSGRVVLSEFKSPKELSCIAAGNSDITFTRITAYEARILVKEGNEHETGLFIDHDGRVRWCEPGDRDG